MIKENKENYTSHRFNPQPNNKKEKREKKETFIKKLFRKLFKRG